MSENADICNNHWTRHEKLDYFFTKVSGSRTKRVKNLSFIFVFVHLSRMSSCVVYLTCWCVNCQHHTKQYSLNGEILRRYSLNDICWPMGILLLQQFYSIIVIGIEWREYKHSDAGARCSAAVNTVSVGRMNSWHFFILWLTAILSTHDAQVLLRI